MTEYRRYFRTGWTYFFTVNLHNRNTDLLTQHIDLLRQSFCHVMQAHPFEIDAIVVLPEHLHCIWIMPETDANYSMRWRQIKTYFSRQLPKVENVCASRASKNERGIWQRRFWEHAIRDEEDYRHHVEYIHNNPIKHGYCQFPQEWSYSSFNKFTTKNKFTSSNKVT